MYTFAKNKQTDEFDVIGPVGLNDGDEVEVTKKDGSTSKVTVEGSGASFVGRFGEHKDRKVQFYKIRRTDESKEPFIAKQTNNKPGQTCPQCETEKLDKNLSCWECGYKGTSEGTSEGTSSQSY